MNDNKRFGRGALAAAMASALLLAGCGGSSSNTPSGGGDSGGGGDDNGGNTPTAFLLSGTVADGYLVGAKVCLDLNRNKICDGNEPSATTTAGGVFDLEVPEGIDADAHPILVEVAASTIDEDDNQPVGASYVLSGPAGKAEFISPMTTMIQARLEANPGMSVDDAENAVKAQLGYSPDSAVSLFEDYVAAQADATDPNRDEYARIHNVARVTAEVLKANHEAIQAAAAQASLDPAAVLDALVAILVQEVIAQLAAIASQVDAAGENFNPETIAGNTVGSVDTTDIKEQVEEQQTAGEAEVTAVQTALAAGIHLLDSERTESGDEFVYVALSVDDQNVLGLDGYFYDAVSKGWMAIPADDEPCYWLTAEGWKSQPCNGATETVTFNEDGSATIDSGRDATRVVTASIDVTGKSIVNFVDAAWREAIPDTAMFNSGATVYSATFTTLRDIYDIGYFNPDGGDCGGVHQGLAGTTNCNVAWKNGQPVTGTSDADLSKLTDGGSKQGLGDTLSVKFLANGTAEFYTDEAGETPVATRPWEITAPVAGGPEILLVDVPAALRAHTWEPELSAKVFFGVYDGFVRGGWFHAAGTVEEGRFYDKAALDDILDYFSPGDAGGEEPAPAVPSALVGSWHVSFGAAGDGGVVLTFLPSGQYMWAEAGDDEETGFSGIEHGSFSWNEQTGALTVGTIFNDTNGDWGMSHQGGGVTITVNGNTLSYSENGGGGAAFTRVTQDSGTIVGSWAAREKDENGYDGLVVLTFLSDDTYFIAQNTPANEGGMPGVEHGAWTSADGALGVTAIFRDTNGEWGLSDLFENEATLSFTIEGRSLVFIEDDGDFSFGEVCASCEIPLHAD